jgi:hypothetical protein
VNDGIDSSTYTYNYCLSSAYCYWWNLGMGGNIVFWSCRWSCHIHIKKVLHLMMKKNIKEFLFGCLSGLFLSIAISGIYVSILFKNIFIFGGGCMYVLVSSLVFKYSRGEKIFKESKTIDWGVI